MPGVFPSAVFIAGLAMEGKVVDAQVLVMGGKFTLNASKWNAQGVVSDVQVDGANITVESVNADYWTAEDGLTKGVIVELHLTRTSAGWNIGAEAHPTVPFAPQAFVVPSV